MQTISSHTVQYPETSTEVTAHPDTRTHDQYDPEWLRIAQSHARPDTARSVWQLLTTLVPLAGLWAAMMFFVNEAYWVTLLLSVPAAAFTIRLFIIQHDCGHRSFFKSRRLNDLVGKLLGVVTWTPHEYWRQAHNIHHATCGNLEQRGIGDITVLTVAEYAALPRWQRLAYRIYRMPGIMLGIGSLYVFGIKFRLPLDLISRRPALLVSVMGTNLAIAGALAVLGVTFGFVQVLMVQFPILLLASTAGVWLFYVQHQFEHTYWQSQDNWDFHESAVMGSTYYELPQPLRWFSGDIGIHHIHHLSSRVPNYRLNDCLAEIPALQTVNRIGLRESFDCFRLALWDESAQRLISFKCLRRMQSAAA